MAFSTYEASLGSLVEVYGSDFPVADDARVELQFKGQFQGADGRVQGVDRSLEARTVNRGAVKWVSLGPYRNPFTANGDEIGTFQGTVAANVIRTMPDGSEQMRSDPSPTAMTFRVLPSIVVRRLQPIGASCAQPAVRGLGGFAYQMDVQALGFQPVSYSYDITTLNTLTGQPETISTRHLAAGPTDSLGNEGEILLPDVPADRQAYGMAVTIRAADAQGRQYTNAFSLGVHRPLEVFYNGNVQVAERLAPVAITQCLPAGDNGRIASYSVGMSESRSRSYNQSWDVGRSTTIGSSRSIGTSSSNSVSISSSNGMDYGWSTNHSNGTMLGASVDVGAGFLSFAKLVGVGVSASRSWSNSTGMNWGLSMGMTNGQSSDMGMSTSEATSDSIGMNYGMGMGISDTVSSSTSVDQSFSGAIIANRYGVIYRQTVKLLRRAAIIAYNKCGESLRVGEVDMIDWAWGTDLAQSNSCGAELPPSNFPPAQCYVPEHCDNR